MWAFALLEAFFALIGVVVSARWIYEELILERLLCVFFGHDPDFTWGSEHTRCKRCFSKVKWSELNV
jgi:hypothetical protein